MASAWCTARARSGCGWAWGWRSVLGFFDRPSRFRDGTERARARGAMGFAATVDTLSESDAYPESGAYPKAPEVSVAARAMEDFKALYDAHLDFVWRSVRRLGVPASAMDDALQDVFVIVHRKVHEFQGRSSIKTWIFGIVVHVARAYRRRRSVDAEE